jgi:hypothetical protein
LLADLVKAQCATKVGALTKGKRKMKTKTKPTKQVPLEIPVQEAELLNHRFWTVRVPASELKVLGEYITSGTMVLKNYGPGKISINNGRRDGLDLESGETRIIFVYQQVSVFATEKSALVVFEYIPELK